MTTIAMLRTLTSMFASWKFQEIDTHINKHFQKNYIPVGVAMINIRLSKLYPIPGKFLYWLIVALSYRYLPYNRGHFYGQWLIRPTSHLCYGEVITSIKIIFHSQRGLVERPLNCWHGWVITCHIRSLAWLLIHVMISVKPYYNKTSNTRRTLGNKIVDH